VIEESKDEPIKKLHLWKDEMDGKGMKVITNKTKVMPIAEEDASSEFWKMAM